MAQGLLRHSMAYIRIEAIIGQLMGMECMLELCRQARKKLLVVGEA